MLGQRRCRFSVGDSDDVIHDWNYLFGKLGCLNHDIQIAHAVQVIGWLGMFATFGWMIWRSVRTPELRDQGLQALARPSE